MCREIANKSGIMTQISQSQIWQLEMKFPEMDVKISYMPREQFEIGLRICALTVSLEEEQSKNKLP